MDILNTRYSLDNKYKMYPSCYYEYITDIYKDCDGEIITINKEINESREASIKYNQELIKDSSKRNETPKRNRIKRYEISKL
jgi:hypothetical protein